jgi:hypothetical protein
MGTGTKTTDSLGALVLPAYPTRANSTNTNDWAATLAVKSNTGTEGRTFNMPRRPLMEVDHNTVRVYLQSRSEVTIDLVTMNGKRVKLLNQGILPEGSRTFSLDKIDLPNGVYMFRLLAGERVSSERKVIVNR